MYLKTILLLRRWWPLFQLIFSVRFWNELSRPETQHRCAICFQSCSVPIDTLNLIRNSYLNSQRNRFYWENDIKNATWLPVTCKKPAKRDEPNRFKYCFDNRNYSNDRSIQIKFTQLASCLTIRQPAVMDILNLFSTFVFISSCYHGVFALGTYYPPRIVSDEKFCSLDWTIEAAFCDSRIRPASRRNLVRLDGKKVIFFPTRFFFLPVFNLSES